MIGVFILTTFFIVLSAERNFLLTSEDASIVLNGYSFARNYSNEITVSTSCPACFIQMNGAFFNNYSDISFIAGGKQYSTADFHNGQLQLVGPITVRSQGDPNYVLAFTIASGSGYPLVIPNLQNYQIQMRSPDNVQYSLNSTHPAITIAQPIDLDGLSMYLSKVSVDGNCALHIYSGGVPGKAGAEKYRITSVSSTDQDKWQGSSLPVTALTLVVDQNCTAVATIRSITEVYNSLDTIKVGSNGVVMSREYPGAFDNGMMGDQWQRRWLGTKGEVVNFNIEVVSSYAGVGGSLNMSVKGYKKQVFEEMFTTDVGDSKQKRIGKTFGVEWHPGQAPRKGFLVRYHVTNASFNPITLTALLFTLLFSICGKHLNVCMHM